MKIGKCIYCKSETSLNREHAFPQSLRQENTPGWIIDNHLCEKCNSDLGELDVVLTQRSNIAFLFDLIQREREQENNSVHASPYHKIKRGMKPIRIPFPNPLYNNHIVLHEPDRMVHELNYMGFKALQPQMILTQYRDGQTCREVVEENNRKYDTKSLRNDNWCIHDEHYDVFCIFGNTYIFPPKTTYHYLDNVDEFKSKYMTDYRHTRYDLWVLSPEVGRGEQKFFDFFDAFQSESKQMIEEDRNLKSDIFRKPIQVIPDPNIKLLSNRAIAKLAFHCFLYHFPKYMGHETMFNSIKNFISRGSGTPLKFVKAIVPHEFIKNRVYKGIEHQHYFRFFIKDKNIGCQMDLFTGLMNEPFSYNVVLAGNPYKKCFYSDSEICFLFYVHPRSPLKKRDISERKRIVLPSEVRFIRSSKTDDWLY